jgi:hypothetical protein
MCKAVINNRKCVELGEDEKQFLRTQRGRLMQQAGIPAVRSVIDAITQRLGDGDKKAKGKE